MKLTEISGGVCAPKGFKANGIHCGIRKNKIKKDLALIVSDVRCNVACVYTTNLVKGAPILVTKKNVADGYAQAVIVNSGNANTCNEGGVEIAEKCAVSWNSIPAFRRGTSLWRRRASSDSPCPWNRSRAACPILSRGWGTTAMRRRKPS